MKNYHKPEGGDDYIHVIKRRTFAAAVVLIVIAGVALAFIQR